jgi:putative NADH-flavin reductase
MKKNTPYSSMKIIVFGAAGAVGSRVVTEAVNRGHEVTAVARQRRSEDFDPAVDVQVRDVASADDLVELIADHDIVISALRPPDGAESSLVPLTQTVVDAARRANARSIIVGGASVLLVPDASGHTVLSAPGFLPDEVVPIAIACKNQYDWCVDQLDSLGAYICPAAMLTPGERTGGYRLGSDTLVTDGSGQSQISMEDFAAAMLDETETPKHIGRRFTVGY